MNKNTIAIAAIFSLALLALTACQQPQAGQNAQNGKVNAQGTIEIEPPSEEVQKLLSLQDQLSQIVRSGALSRCSELSMTQYQNSCQVNILANRAQSAEDTAVCDEAGNEELKKQCLTLVAGKK
jgi:hypothetical protein